MVDSTKGGEDVIAVMLAAQSPSGLSTPKGGTDGGCCRKGKKPVYDRIGILGTRTGVRDQTRLSSWRNLRHGRTVEKGSRGKVIFTSDTIIIHENSDSCRRVVVSERISTLHSKWRLYTFIK